MNSAQENLLKYNDANIEKIYRFVFLRVNSKEHAQDLTSETFVEMLGELQSQTRTISKSARFSVQNRQKPGYRPLPQAGSGPVDQC